MKMYGEVEVKLHLVELSTRRRQMTSCTFLPFYSLGKSPR
jgi:hypothetical protein